MNSLFLFVIFIIALIMALLVGFFVGLTFGDQLTPLAVSAIQSVTA